jgi:nucleoid DNA-binding protein
VMAGLVFPIAYKSDSSGLKEAESQFKKFGEGVKGILETAGIGLGVAEVVNVLKESAHVAVESSQSQALLANQLRNTTGASDEQIASVEESIQKMQEQAAVSANVIRPAFDQLARATGNVTEATKLTSLALDVAAGTGKDLQTVSVALGKAYQGNTGSLQKLGIAIKNVSDPLGSLQTQFAGAAETAASNDPFAQMQIVMEDLQITIGTDLLPALKGLAAYLKSKDFKGTVDSAQTGFETIGTAVNNIGTALDQMVSKLGGAKNSISGFFDSMFGNGNWVKAIPIIGAYLSFLGSSQVTNAIQGINNATSAADRNAHRGTTSGASTLPTPIPTKTQAKAAVKTFFDTLSEDMAKQTAILKLKSLGASQGLIDSIIGSGATWEASFKKIAATGSKGVAALQKQFSKTASGAAEIQAASDAAAKAAKDAYDAALKSAQDAFQAATDAATKANEAIDSFHASITDALTSVAPLDFAEKSYGRFESAVVSTFDSIKASIKDALANKTILDDAASALQKYAASEASILQGIARQRDVIAAKIGIAQTIMGNVVSFGNITSLLNNQAQTVTKTYQKTIDGILVTFSEAVAATNPQDIVANYKAIIQQTKDFATNLKALKAAGLNQNLFKQIVDAGVSAGGATAAAIVAGGSDTINEMNNLFAELNQTGNDIAQTSTDTLYQAGLDTIGGFIQGLMDQDAALQQQAADEAKAFTDAFQAQLDKWTPNVKMPSASDFGLSPDQSKLIPEVPKVVVPNVTQVLESNNAIIAPTASSRYGGGNNYTISVSAGLGTDGKNVGSQIVNAIKQYERTNGSVWVAV